MIQRALKSMQQHLDVIEDKHVYDQLSQFSYLHTTEWRLKFLRSDLYDCKLAAERLVRFTEYMHQEYDLVSVREAAAIVRSGVQRTERQRVDRML
jgi:hypothetical protein